MKIKVNTSPIYIILVGLAVLDCGITEAFSLSILGDSGITGTFVAVAAVLLFINSIANKRINNTLKPYRNYTNSYLIILAIFIMATTIYSYNRYGQGAISLFICFRSFLYLFLITSLIYMFESQNGYQSYLKILVWLVLIVLAIKLFTSVVYNFTGTLLLPAVSEGLRYGRLRTHVPPAFGIAVSFVIYKIFEEKLQKNKLKWFAIFTFILIYLIYSCMTRALLIGVAVTILVMYLLRPRAKTNQVIVWVLLISIVILFAATGLFNFVIESFSESNAETGSSTLARQLAREYFTQYTEYNPIFSMGFVCPNTTYFYTIFFGENGTCCFDDLGISNMWYHFGILGVIVATVMFARLIYLFFKIYYINKSEHRVFVAGTLAYLISTQVSLGAFDGQRMFTLLCIWAIFEYEGKTKKTKSLDRMKINLSNNEKAL